MEMNACAKSWFEIFYTEKQSKRSFVIVRYFLLKILRDALLPLLLIVDFYFRYK